MDEDDCVLILVGDLDEARDGKPHPPSSCAGFLDPSPNRFAEPIHILKTWALNPRALQDQRAHPTAEAEREAGQQKEQEAQGINSRNRSLNPVP